MMMRLMQQRGLLKRLITTHGIKEVKVMKDKMKVNILGTEYDVELLDDRDETMKAMSCDGYTDYSVKKIRVLFPFSYSYKYRMICFINLIPFLLL